MSTGTSLAFRRFDGAGARAIRDIVQMIHDDAYAKAAENDPVFSSTEAFMDRFDSYASPQNSGFELVMAYSGGEPVGQTWGWPLKAGSAWWTGLIDEPEPGFTHEDGHRTFALSEIMVRHARTGEGIAHAMHDELLMHRPEQRATLLVDPANPTDAYTAYLKWGWRKVAQLRPKWPGAPLFDVLLLDLTRISHDHN